VEEGAVEAMSRPAGPRRKRRVVWLLGGERRRESDVGGGWEREEGEGRGDRGGSASRYPTRGSTVEVEVEVQRKGGRWSRRGLLIP